MTKEGEQFDYTPEDIFYVKYFPEKEYLLVFIIRYRFSFIFRYSVVNKKIEMVVLSKDKGNDLMTKVSVIELVAPPNYLDGATYICSDSYLYRGFGKFKLPQSANKIYNTAIHQFRIVP